jgi:hypothetical protein
VSKFRAELFLPLACAGACAMLAASEFMDTFKLNGPGPTLQVVQTAEDQHHFALLVLAAFALGALLVAVLSGSKPAATAVAICGAIALLIFLLIDLPDAGKVGTISDVTFTQAKAEPATGFWLELTGALVLAVCGTALATLTPEQLRTFGDSLQGMRPSSRYRGSRPAPPPDPETKASGEGKSTSSREAAKTESG